MKRKVHKSSRKWFLWTNWTEDAVEQTQGHSSVTSLSENYDKKYLFDFFHNKNETKMK